MKDGGFVFFNYHNPVDLPPELKGTFDMIVADPPYITIETWEKYKKTIDFLL